MTTQEMTDPSVTRQSAGELRLVSRQTQVKEWMLAALFFACAFAAVLAVALIFAFVGWKAWPITSEVGISNFLAGRVWAPTDGSFGILPLIQVFVVTLGALVLGTPLAVGTAIFLSGFATPRMRAVVRPAVELLAGIPSVVYGFFGVVMLRPIIGSLTGGVGFGAVTAGIILAIMIVPTIAALSEDALNSIPWEFAKPATPWAQLSGRPYTKSSYRRRRRHHRRHHPRHGSRDRRDHGGADARW